jgi:hypothetical protein
MQVLIRNSAHFDYTSNSPRTHCKCNCCICLMLIHDFQTLNIDLKCSPPNTTPSLSPDTIINLNILTNCNVRSSQQVPAHWVSSNLNHDDNESVTESDTDGDEPTARKKPTMTYTIVEGVFRVERFKKSHEWVHLL